MPDSNAAIMRKLLEHEKSDTQHFEMIESRLATVVSQNKMLGALIIAAGVASFFGHA